VADLLVAWHAATPAGSCTGSAALSRLASRVEAVRRARLDTDVGELHRACQRLCEVGHDQAQLTAAVRVTVADLERALAAAAAPAPCLVDCASCAAVPRARA
jgi:hypothetical protein